MKNQINVRIEDFPFSNLVKYTINKDTMIALDKDINLPGEQFILAGYKTEKGIRPFYVLNKDITH